jgi:hypothetical protein
MENPQDASFIGSYFAFTTPFCSPVLRTVARATKSNTYVFSPPPVNLQIDFIDGYPLYPFRFRFFYFSIYSSIAVLFVPLGVSFN